MNIKQLIKLIIALCMIDDEEFEELKRQTALKREKMQKKHPGKIFRKKINNQNK